MTEVPFSSLCRRFAGQTGWVVGRGPTGFRYEELAGASGPVFFINDAVSLEKWLPAAHASFFFAHDRSMGDWLQSPSLRSLPVLITDQPIVGPEGDSRPGLLSGADDPVLAKVARAIFYRGCGPLDRASLLDRGREEIRDSRQLYLANGTIQPLLHFAWYLGCSHLNLIGCDGLPGVGYDGRLENRSRSSQHNAIFIRRRQEILLRRLALPRTYLGTPAHRIRMIMEARADPANHDRLRGWSQVLLRQFRTAGCEALEASDRLATGRGFWINGTWPALEPCIDCLASPAHLALIAAADALVEGGVDVGLNSAFQALP